MNMTEGFRRVVVGISFGAISLGALLLVISFAVFLAGTFGWTSIQPSIPVVQSAGWMLIFGLVLNRVAKARPVVEKR